MKVRAYEVITIAVDGIPQIDGMTLTDWKNLLGSKGITRNVNITGRNLHNWDAHLADGKTWEGVPAQPNHVVDTSKIEFSTYKHGGKLELQAVYFFEIEG